MKNPASNAGEHCLESLDATVPLTHWEGALVPKHCCTCGKSSKRTRKISRFEKVDPRDVQRKSWLTQGLVALLFCGLPGLLVAALGESFANRNRDQGAGFSVRVNQCKACAKQRRLIPYNVDFNDFQMTIDVRADYKQEWLQLNR